MEQQHVYGMVIGASSLVFGYVLHQLAEARAREVSYLHHTPQFTDFRSLREHLTSSPGQSAQVLVEGVTKKLNESLKSEHTGTEGAAMYTTTTTYSKVYHEDSRKWRDMSNTLENVRLSIPFQIVDPQAYTVTIRSVEKAGGFRQILDKVYQFKTPPESRSIGDHATNMELREIPNGNLTREFMLVFGTTIGAYGSATLSGQSFLSSGDVSFTPVEVASSVSSLISRNEMSASAFRLFSYISLIGGGTVLVLCLAPMLLKLLGFGGQTRRRRAVRGRQENADSDVDSGNDSEVEW